jgi:hypothetical protein
MCIRHVTLRGKNVMQLVFTIGGFHRVLLCPVPIKLTAKRQTIVDKTLHTKTL